MTASRFFNKFGTLSSQMTSMRTQGTTGKRRRLTGIGNKACDLYESLETWRVNSFISVLSSLFLFFFPPLITFSFSMDSMYDYDTKEKENFQARNKPRRKFIMSEILAHECNMNL